MVPVCFGLRLVVSLAAHAGVSEWMGLKMASLLGFEELACWYPFVLVLVWAPPNHKSTSADSLWTLPGGSNRNLQIPIALDL